MDTTSSPSQPGTLQGLQAGLQAECVVALPIDLSTLGVRIVAQAVALVVVCGSLAPQRGTQRRGDEMAALVASGIRVRVGRAGVCVQGRKGVYMTV